MTYFSTGRSRVRQYSDLGPLVSDGQTQLHRKDRHGNDGDYHPRGDADLPQYDKHGNERGSKGYGK